MSLRSQAPQQQYIVHCMHFGITLWAYLSELLVQDSRKHLSSMEMPQYRMLKLQCECGNSFNVEHALSCAIGGFPSLRHNEIQDITASLLTEVCSEVCVEPDLQPVTPDQLNGASADSQDGARLDVSANEVWGGRFQKTYFDVRVFNPLAPSNRNQAPAAVYRKNELEKKRAYQQRVQEVEHSSFSPLVLSATGGIGMKPPSFTSAWHRCSPRSGTSHTARPYVGYGAT